jgi:peptide/nickel transport system permease protein
VIVPRGEPSRSAPLLRFLKTPGSYRILLGGGLVGLLLVAASFGSRWTRFEPGQMDFEHLLSPPAATWLMRLTTTAQGRKALIENRESVEVLEDSLAAPSPQGANSQESDEGGDAGWMSAVAGVSSASSNMRVSQKRDSLSLEAYRLSDHALGTDKDGRDLVALLVAGARNCLLSGCMACAVALGIGLPLGLLAGYYEGFWRRTLRILSGTLLSLPRMVVILVVICAFNPNIFLTMGVLGITLIPRVSELIATRVRTLSRTGLVLAAREGGLSDFRILSRHLFWYQNRAVFFIQASLIMSEAILMETTLSYLQFGIKPPEVSWGNIIEGSRLTFFSGQYWVTFFPALAIVLAILGFFYLGDGLNARMTFRESR